MNTRKKKKKKKKRGQPKKNKKEGRRKVRYVSVWKRLKIRVRGTHEEII